MKNISNFFLGKSGMNYDFFFLNKKKEEKLSLWGQIISRLLFRLNGLGLWPNDPVQGHKYIWGRSTKVEVKMALQEELKGIYDRSKPIRDEKSPRNFYLRWFETFLSSWIQF